MTRAAFVLRMAIRTAVVPRTVNAAPNIIARRRTNPAAPVRLNESKPLLPSKGTIYRVGLTLGTIFRLCDRVIPF